jgi:serine/threonine-protein kinase
VIGGVEQRAGLLLTDESRLFSPELVLGKEFSRSSDIYQAGTTLYYLLTGEMPFKDKKGLALSATALKKQPLPPSAINPKVPKYLDDIVMMSLYKDPMMRFESAEQFVESINNHEIAKKGIDISGFPEMEKVIPEEAGSDTEPEKAEIKKAVSGKPEKSYNFFRWVMIAVWTAIAAGIIYSLINIFVMGE